MTDKLLSDAENAYVAFSDYRYAMHDEPLEFPHIAFAKLEEAMRKLGDAIDDVTADAMLKEMNDE